MCSGILPEIWGIVPRSPEVEAMLLGGTLGLDELVGWRSSDLKLQLLRGVGPCWFFDIG